jgi:hypothetical protein
VTAEPEVIEGVAVEIPERAVAVVQQPGQSLVAQSADPADMVAVAARLATVLRDIVDRQRLYTVIQGKSYPQVEAWQTIGRLDNVVAREARPPIRHDDGSYEAYAELIRLSDGMVIGAASAICGSPDDEPWGGTPAKNGKPAKGPRPENARRSMAATRAISRAFRGQYAWIMALAGYEPTPAEEMPSDSPADRSSSPASPAPVRAPSTDGGTLTGSWEGTFDTTATADAQVREDRKRGATLKFVVKDPDPNPGHRRINVRVYGDLATAVRAGLDAFGNPDAVTVWGDLSTDSFTKDGKEIVYAVCEATRVMTADWTAPATDAAPGGSTAPTEDGKVSDLDDLPF